MSERKEVLLKAVEFLRTFELPPGAPEPDMKNLWHDCGGPSCPAAWLWKETSFREGLSLDSSLSGVEWEAVFGAYELKRLTSLARLGIDLPPGAQTGTLALRDAADRLEAVLRLEQGHD